VERWENKVNTDVGDDRKTTRRGKEAGGPEAKLPSPETSPLCIGSQWRLQPLARRGSNRGKERPWENEQL